MTEKNGWGGTRKGAGRPRVKKPPLKGGYMRTVKTQPRKGEEDPLLKQAGVRVLSKRKISPYLMQARSLVTNYQAAKAEYSPRALFRSVLAYEGMDSYLKEYLRNWLVRKSIDSLAYWSTKEGYETELESTTGASQTEDEEERMLEPYKYLKDYVDKINKNVDLDQVLRTAIVKTQRHGHAGFEIERAPNSDPIRLIPLRSEYLTPLIDKTWTLKGYQYEGKGTLSEPFYAPDEILYFVKDDLEGDLVGLSQIEPILNECEVDNKIFAEDLPEALTVLWAGVLIFLLDRAKLTNATDADVQTIINNFAEQIKPGKSIVTEDIWSATVADLKPDLDKILAVADKIERRIVGNFGVPLEILNLQVEGWSRATGMARLQAFVDGPISDIQRTFKRQVEHNWYEPLIRQKMGMREGKLKLIKLNGILNLWRGRRFRAQEQLPVMMKHVWREIRTSDWFEQLKTVSDGYAGGTGFYGIRKAYELMSKGKSVDWDYEKEFPEQMSPQESQPLDLATSPPFETKPEAIEGIEDFKQMIQDAPIVDLAGQAKKKGKQ